MNKILFVFLAITAVVYADDDWKVKTGEELQAIRTVCLKEHPIADNLLEKMKSFEYPDDESVRQYLLCSSKKLGIFCSHRGYHADRLAQQFRLNFEESEVVEIVNGCLDKNEQGSPVDVWAFRGHQCIMRSKIGDRLKSFIKNKAEKTA